MKIEVGRIYRDPWSHKTYYMFVTKIDEYDNIVWYKYLDELDGDPQAGFLERAQMKWHLLQ